MESSDDDVIRFPGVTAQEAADRRMYGRHCVAQVQDVLENVMEMLEEEGARGLAVVSVHDDGVRVFSTHDRLLTEFLLRSAATRMQL